MDKDFFKLPDSEENLRALQEIHELLWITPKGWFWKTYLMVISYILLIGGSMLVGLWPISQLYLHAKIHEYEAVKVSVDHARLVHPPKNDAEMRGIQVSIIRWNGWLAYWKAWNKVPLIELYIPDHIEKLEPIE